MKFRPLTVWPKTPTKLRKSGTFRVKYEAMLTDLRHELEAVNAKNVTIGAFLTADQIRIDGAIRAGAKPSMPGIILYFENRHGSLSFANDEYDDWQDNIRAISLTLQSLRAIDRYGATAGGEQYKGFAALPSKDASADAVSHIQNPAYLLLYFAGAKDQDTYECERIKRDENYRKDIYKKAVKATHPDTGGNAANFIKVKAAFDALEGQGL